MTQRGLYRRNVGDALGHFNQGDPASPDTFVRRSMSRYGLSTGALATTGKMTFGWVTLAAGDVVTNISFETGSTAGGTMTAWWMALYDTVGARMAQTADQTSGAIAASTVITKALATAQTIKVPGLYRVGLSVTATTIPTVIGQVCAQAVATGESALAFETDAGSLGATAPATIPASTARSFAPLFVLT